jgi:hypothetical protein
VPGRSRWPLVYTLPMRTAHLAYFGVGLALAIVAGISLRPKVTKTVATSASASAHEAGRSALASARNAGSLESVAVASADPLVGELAPLGSARAPASEVKVPWGKGGFGKRTNEEGHEEGPASFTRLPSGELAVIDQVQERIAVVGSAGTVVRELKLPFAGASDVAALPNGKLAVLSATDDGKIAILDANGRVDRTVDVPKTFGFESGREVSRMVVRGDRVLVQQNGVGPMLQLPAEDGQEQKVEKIQGLPSADGRHLVSAGVVSKDRTRIWLNLANAGSAEMVWTKSYRFDSELSAIGFLDTSPDGVIFLVAYGSYGAGNYINWLACFDQDTGKSVALHTLSYDAYGSFRDFELDPRAGLIVSHKTESGVTFSTYSCSRLR